MYNPVPMPSSNMFNNNVHHPAQRSPLSSAADLGALGGHRSRRQLGHVHRGGRLQSQGENAGVPLRKKRKTIGKNIGKAKDSCWKKDLRKMRISSTNGDFMGVVELI